MTKCGGEGGGSAIGWSVATVGIRSVPSGSGAKAVVVVASTDGPFEKSWTTQADVTGAQSPVAVAHVVWPSSAYTLPVMVKSSPREKHLVEGTPLHMDVAGTLVAEPN